MGAAARCGEFIATVEVPETARERAREAIQDTLGVALAGVSEPVSTIVQAQALREAPVARARIVGTRHQTSEAWAALANGTAAHALDFDDMCWVSMAHPSAPLVAAGVAAAETVAASGRRLLDGYVVGFEVAAALGRTMNPRHYENGWHCTSTIGTLAAAATVARVKGLDAKQSAASLSIAASEASGVKANFGTMVKPLQVGLAARNGVLACQLAVGGLTAAEVAIDGPQGFLMAMQSSSTDMTESLRVLGQSWEILQGGITMKLYPSCAATHPTIDTIRDLKREHGIEATSVEAIEIAVDAVTPTVLVYDTPRTGLEGKFSLHFCAAAALGCESVGIETFDSEVVADPVIRALQDRVTMRVDETLGVEAPPLTQAHVRLRLNDGRSFERAVTGARGYPDRPPSREERQEKFRACATRALPSRTVEVALDLLEDLQHLDSIPRLTTSLTPGDGGVTAVDLSREPRMASVGADERGQG